jgi:hypothetical protein
MRIAFVNRPTALTSTRMATNGTAIGDDHVTRSRRPNWTIAALAIHLMTNTAITGATFDIDGGQQLVEG